MEGHTATPPAQIEAVVTTENIGQIRVEASADPEMIFGDDDAEENAREYLLEEFEEVVTITDVY